MNIVYTAQSIALAIQKYKNWAEAIKLIAKRQELPKVILKNGIQIEGDKELRPLMCDIFFRKLYNPAHLEIESNDVVIDIGAHYGVFTFFAASITRNSIYAFEPSPRNFEILERNIRLNGMNNVIAYNSAVSGKNGSTTFFLNPTNDQSNQLFDFIPPDPGKIEGWIELEVPTTTLQDIMDRNKLEQVDFLKMDCEGAEGSILNSTSQEYLRRVRKIAVEFHDHKSQFNHNELQKLLEERGFFTKLRWDKKSPYGAIYGWRHRLSSSKWVQPQTLAKEDGAS